MNNQPSPEHLRMIEKTVERAESGFGPTERNAAVAWLMENVDGYLDHAIRCGECKNAHMPVAAVRDRLLCPICYANSYIAGWEALWSGER